MRVARPIDESQDMLLIDGTRRRRMDLPRAKGPPICSISARCFLRLKAASMVLSQGSEPLKGSEYDAFLL